MRARELPSKFRGFVVTRQLQTVLGWANVGKDIFRQAYSAFSLALETKRLSNSQRSDDRKGTITTDAVSCNAL